MIRPPYICTRVYVSIIYLGSHCIVVVSYYKCSEGREMSFNALITFVWDFNCQLHLVTLGSTHTWCHQKQNSMYVGIQEKNL